MSDIVGTSEAGPAAIRGGILRAGAFAGGLLLGIVAAPLLVRHLGDADFGRYSAVLAVIMIVNGLTEGGINTIAVRELSSRQDPVERDRVMRDLLGLRMVLSAVGIGLAVAFSAAAGYGSTLVLGTFIGAVGMATVVLQTLVATVLQSRLRFGWAALIELVRQAFVAATIVVLVVLDGSVLAFLAASVPAAAIALAITVALVRGTITLRPAFHPGRWLPLLRETLAVAIAVAVNAIYFRVALVVTSLVATAVETGHLRDLLPGDGDPGGRAGAAARRGVPDRLARGADGPGALSVRQRADVRAQRPVRRAGRAVARPRGAVRDPGADGRPARSRDRRAADPERRGAGELRRQRGRLPAARARALPRGGDRQLRPAGAGRGSGAAAGEAVRRAAARRSPRPPRTSRSR